MCGRFSLSTPGETLKELFGLDAVPELEPRYNIAPAQSVPVVLRAGHVAGPVLVMKRWGLVPWWATDPKLGARMINARAETLTSKPAFRDAVRERRCLVPADGFYEWVQDGRRRQPIHFHLKDGQPFAFAGLWELWRPAGADALDTFTIITTRANELVAPVHDRMPVILPEEWWEDWLDPRRAPDDALMARLGPLPADRMAGFRVDPRVNSPLVDDAACVAPLLF
jgi:putative SOS response-associated peptidase YedK